MKKALVGIFVIILGLGTAYAIYRYRKDDSVVKTEPDVSGTSIDTPSISEEEIHAENFSGTKPVIGGSGPLARAARAHIDERVAAFQALADAEVPDMREEYGSDSPPATYTIDLKANMIESDRTRSIVVTEYVYTGGAHGSSSYWTATALQSDGTIIALADIIRKSEREAFAALVKEKLLAWRPDGGNAPVVFEEEVEGLTFDSFQNWSLDDQNLTLYFSQYEVGPGVLGAFPLSIPRSQLSGMLQ